MLSLLDNIQIKRVLAPVVAGTSTQTTSSVDCAGKQCVLFVTGLGTLSAGNVNTVKIQGSDDNSAWVDLTASSFTVPDSEDNLLVLAQVVRPVHRYVRLSIARATANAVIDLVIAISGVFVRNHPLANDGADISHYGNLNVVSPAGL